MTKDDDAVPPGRDASSVSVTLAIRNSTAHHAPGTAEVHVISSQSTYAGLLPQALRDGLPVDQRSADWLRNITTGEATIQFPANPAGKVAGCIATGSSRDTDGGSNVG